MNIHVILFYKYHPLSEDRLLTEAYRRALEDLCRSLNLIGRILVGCSKNEGINGTLAGSHAELQAFTTALLGRDVGSSSVSADPGISQAIASFRTASCDFFQSINEPELIFDSPEDFKWSVAQEEGHVKNDGPLFPDLNVKLVSELIGTGGKLLGIPLAETAKGYLTPREWHDRLRSSVDDKDTILIDCRNMKEYAIGHFIGAVEPMTTTFSQFPKWVEDHKAELCDKKVLMYCTGGIRCEKASAFIRRTVPSVKDVNHLKGGVHKYLEEFGNDLFVGKNFVFDNRLAATGDSGRGITTSAPSKQETIGRCISCKDAYDAFDPRFVCTVCREPVLVCLCCRATGSEFHCKNHSHLRTCYFSNLVKFDRPELIRQRTELVGHLDQIAVGRRFKQKRKTLAKQISRLDLLIEANTGTPSAVDSNGTNCRSCNRVECDGKCWGFHGLARKRKVEEDRSSSDRRPDPPVDALRRNVHHQASLLDSWRVEHSRLKEEMHKFACRPPSVFRDEATGIRVPETTFRTLQCQTKAKWCGLTLVNVVQSQFAELRQVNTLRKTIEQGLLYLNGEVVSSMADASEYKLRHSDCISRVVHWHEAPVKVPAKISVQEVQISAECLDVGSPDERFVVYVCDKPSTVPVHPAGPYFANSLTCMLEGQEALPPASCKPIHRTDRATSGLTLCCTNAMVAKAFHRALAEGNAEKMYLARVGGRFPSHQKEWHSVIGTIGKCEWHEEVVLVDAPVGAVEAASGTGSICPSGKSASSLFRFVGYDAKLDASLVACRPITGRNHQIRLHLQWLGFPIVGDTLYGGRSLSSEIHSSESMREERINTIVEVMLQRCIERQESNVDDRDYTVEQRAHQACSLCSRPSKEGIVVSYSAAQLLQDGHEIHLHALRYKFKLTNKKTSATEEVCFEVCPPSWARGLSNENLSLQWNEFEKASANR